MIHRDIKPQNVLVTENGDVKVTDFGIARAASSSTITQEGFALGTAAYMSPEQAAGKKIGPASDLYSLGVVMYEMLTGELPNRNGSLGVSPKELQASISEEMDDLIGRLLARNPADRPSSAASVAEELRRTDAISPATEALETAKMVPWLLAIMFIVIVALAGLVFWNLLGSASLL